MTMPRETTWAKAMKDPHLMRLGDYLLHVERNAGWEFGDSDILEERFQEEPWMNWVQVVLAESPQNGDLPFVLLANGDNKGQRSHAHCPLSNPTASRYQEKVCTARILCALHNLMNHFNISFLSRLNCQTRMKGNEHSKFLAWWLAASKQNLPSGTGRKQRREELSSQCSFGKK